MKTIELRQAGPADEPFLEDVARLAMGWRDGTSPPLTPLTEKYVRGYGRPGDHGIVALFDEARVGAAWWRLFSAEDRSYGYVRDDVPELTLGVKQQVRRHGIATTLLDRLLADAVPQGVPAVSLSVELDNNAARLLYERLGFVKAAEVGNAWTMLRSISR